MHPTMQRAFGKGLRDADSTSVVPLLTLKEPDTDISSLFPMAILGLGFLVTHLFWLNCSAIRLTLRWQLKPTIESDVRFQRTKHTSRSFEKKTSKKCRNLIQWKQYKARSSRGLLKLTLQGKDFCNYFDKCRVMTWHRGQLDALETTAFMSNLH